MGLPAVTQVSQFGTRGALENPSDKTAEMVDTEIRAWLDTAYKDAVKLLTKNRATVERLAQELLERETLTGEEIQEIVSGKKQGAKKTTKKAPTKKETKSNAKKSN